MQATRITIDKCKQMQMQWKGVSKRKQLQTNAHTPFSWKFSLHPLCNPLESGFRKREVEFKGGSFHGVLAAVLESNLAVWLLVHQIQDQEATVTDLAVSAGLGGFGGFGHDS